MILTDRLRVKWQAGQPTFGLWLGIPSPVTAELAVICEPDYACLDQQHGLIGYDAMVPMLCAMRHRDVVPLTRVPANEPSSIGKALDAGACGVIVPMVETAEAAAAAVASCRYSPDGVRSFGPMRGARIMGSRTPAELGGGALCIVMVETRRGLENVDEIARTPGVDAIYVGPADLAVAFGLQPGLDRSETEHVAAIERIRQACDAAGIVAGIQCSSGRRGRKYAEAGFRMVTVSKDSVALEHVFRAQLADASQAEVTEVDYA